jgi:hypothetical protein
MITKLVEPCSEKLLKSYTMCKTSKPLSFTERHVAREMVKPVTYDTNHNILSLEKYILSFEQSKYKRVFIKYYASN